MTMHITLTDSAAARIAELAQGDHADQVLRLAVDAGGCSGFEYKYSFADTAGSEDETFTKHGARLIIDRISLGLLDGATLDYERGLMGAHFKIINPNAASGCGCGNSFSV